MILLQDIFDKYKDIWLEINTNHHKENSYARFFEIRTKGKAAYIKLFSYYPKTNNISYFRIMSLKHLSWIKFAQLNKDMEDKLEALYAKAILTENGPAYKNV